MRITTGSCLLVLVMGAVASDVQPSRRAQECIPTSGTLDDSPALQKALVDCGDGGNILLEAGKTYNIGSVVDFASCKTCTIQVEGTISLGSNASYWVPQHSIFGFQNTNGVKIYSSTGAGLIKGNGPGYWEIPYNSTYKRRWPILFNIANSSNIAISNMRIQNPSFSVFDIKHSQDLQFSSVSIVIDEMKKNTRESLIGFAITQSTRISITNSTVKNAYESCIDIRGGTSFLTVENFECIGYFRGVVIAVEQTPGLPLSDISLRNLSISEAIAPTGLLANTGLIKMTNIIYDGVKLNNTGNSAVWTACTSGSSFCSRYASTQDVKSFTFKNYEGNALYTSMISCRRAEGATCNIAFQSFNIAKGIELEF